MTQLPEIIQNSGEIGEMEYDIFKVTVKKLDLYEKTLVNCNNTGEYRYD